MKRNTIGAALCALLMAVNAHAVMAQITVTKKTTIEINTETGDSAKYVEERHPGGFDFSLGFLQAKFGKGEGGTERHSPCTLEVLGSVGVGFTTTLGRPTGMSTNMGQSIEVDWSNVVALGYEFNRHNKMTLGFGMMWRNWRMTDRNQFVQSANGQIALQPYPADANPRFSRLHSFMLTMPLTYIHKWKHGWRVAVGPELCFKSPKDKYNTIKTRYELDGEKHKDITKGVHFTPVTVNLTASVMYKYVGIYARYSPMNVLDTDFGPSFQSFTVGLRFGW